MRKVTQQCMSTLLCLMPFSSIFFVSVSRAEYYVAYGAPPPVVWIYKSPHRAKHYRSVAKRPIRHRKPIVSVYYLFPDYPTCATCPPPPCLDDYYTCQVAWTPRCGEPVATSYYYQAFHGGDDDSYEPKRSHYDPDLATGDDNQMTYPGMDIDR